MDHVVALHKKTEAEDIRKSKNSLAHEVTRSNMLKHVHMMTFDHFLKVQNLHFVSLDHRMESLAHLHQRQIPC